MALATTMVWEVRTTGDDLNGGGFKPGASGTDYSQQDAAQLSLTDLACVAASTTLTSATGGFTAAMVGNCIQIASGTNFVASWYEITAYTNTNTVTIDRTAASGGDASAGVGKVGGALASPGWASAAVVTSMTTDRSDTVWIKTGTYTISSASVNVQNGVPKFYTGAYGGVSWSAPIQIRGYYATRGDTPTEAQRPVMEATTSLSGYMLILSDYSYAADLIVDANLQTSTGSCYTSVGYTAWVRIKAIDHNGASKRGFVDDGYTSAYWFCEATSSSGDSGGGFYAVNSGDRYIGCVAHDMVGHGFNIYNGTFYCCLAYRITGTNMDGFNFGPSVTGFGCTAFKVNRHGFNFAAGSNGTVQLVNCIAAKCGAYGFRASAAYVGLEHLLVNCAGWSNTSGNYDTNWPSAGIVGFVALSATPFTDASETPGGAADFSLNNNNPGGAQCRAAGFGSLPGGLTLSYPDIGVSQHQDPAGGGGGGQPVLGAGIVR